MGFLELFLIAVGLSMDAFAVAICQGLSMGNRNLGRCALVALFFGGFQALMPLVGYTLGVQFQAYITSVDHWLAFLLLSFIGLKMIHEARKPRKKRNAQISASNPSSFFPLPPVSMPWPWESPSPSCK